MSTKTKKASYRAPTKKLKNQIKKYINLLQLIADGNGIDIGKADEPNELERLYRTINEECRKAKIDPILKISIIRYIKKGRAIQNASFMHRKRRDENSLPLIIPVSQGIKSPKLIAVKGQLPTEEFRSSYELVNFDVRECSNLEEIIQKKLNPPDNSAKTSTSSRKEPRGLKKVVEAAKEIMSPQKKKS